MIRTICFALSFLLVLLLIPTSGHAGYRERYEDAQIVERSELIVVGYLKIDSIKYVPHDNGPGRGASWEHHAALVVTEVLKGKSEEKEIAVTIHYGLDPVVDGITEKEGRKRVNLRGNRKDYPKGMIEILDTGNSSISITPLVKDAGKNNIWFLCKRKGTYGREFGGDSYGIADPEDLQPLCLKDYFLAYMSKDPEQAVKQEMEKTPEIEERAQRYLDHMEIQRILKIPDLEQRIEKLLPYYFRDFQWEMKSEVSDGIKECGEITVPYLIKILEEEEKEHERSRKKTIRLLGEIGSKRAAPVLIGLLEEHDKHWEKEMAKPDWESSLATNSGPNGKAYSETYYGVYALSKIGDPAAIDAIELTKKRWELINHKRPQVIEGCEQALKVLLKKEKELQKE